jgi:SAM-dependent methyltransferase
MNEWQQRYETQDTPWEKGGPHPGLVEFLRRQPISGRVLVPGCGTGHDVRALAATADEVVGLDIAPAAIATAKAYPEVGGERFVVGDLFALPASMRGQFDWVFEHTCFCAIPRERRGDYAQAVAGALAPGGHLLAIFFLNPDMDPGENGPPFGASVSELDALFGENFELLVEWPPTATFPGREGRELCRLLRRK